MFLSVVLPMTFVVLSWGLASSIEVLSLRTLTPVEFTFFSSLLGMFGAMLISAFNGRNKKATAVCKHFYARTFLLSMLGFAGYFLLKYTAYALSPVPQANVIHYSFTIFIVLFASPLLGQRIGPAKLTGVVIGFAGVAVVMSDAGSFGGFRAAHLPGYFFALGAGISFALFSVLMEKWQLDRLRSLVFLHGFSAAVLGIFLIATGGIQFPDSSAEILGAAYNGIVANALGMYFWLYAQSKCRDVSILTGVLYFIPFISLFFLRLLLAFPVPAATYTGLAFIVSGMLVHTVRSRMKKNR